MKPLLFALFMLVPSLAFAQACLTNDSYQNGSGYYLPVDGYVTNLSCQMQSVPYTIHTLTVRYNQSDTIVKCTLNEGACTWTAGTNGQAIAVAKGQRITIKETDPNAVDGGVMSCLVGVSDNP